MISRVTLLGAIFFATGLFAQAGTIVYTSIYNPLDLPATSPASPGALYWSETAAGTSTASVLDGVLSVSTMPGIATTRAWSVGQSGVNSLGSSSAWNITPSGGATVDFTLRVTASSGGADRSPQIIGGFNLFFGTGTHIALLSFGTGNINAQAAANTYLTHANTVETTYRLVIQDNLFSLYKEGSETAIFNRTAMSASVGNNVLTWGDNQAGVSGGFELSFLGWNNTHADFSAPVVIPEPGMVALALLGGGFLLVAARRKG